MVHFYVNERIQDSRMPTRRGLFVDIPSGSGKENAAVAAINSSKALLKQDCQHLTVLPMGTGDTRVLEILE